MKRASLGPLEQEIIAHVWRQQTCTTRDVVESLTKNREIAYNTVQTVMTRLVNKGLLKRRLKGKTHVYQPTAGQKSLLASLIHQTIGGLTRQFGEAALIAFVDDLEEISPRTRRQLIEKLKHK